MKIKSISKSKQIIFIFVILLLSAFTSNVHSQIINPFGGENGEYWTQYTHKLIQWDTSMFTGNVNIYVWDRITADYTKIVGTVGNPSISGLLGQYNWLIPENFPTGTYFRIKVEQVDTPSIFQITPTFFPIYSAEHQTIALRQGWNMLSSYIIPNENEIEYVTSQISDKITTFQDVDSNTYCPSCSTNTLSEWNYLKAYKVYLSSADTLSIFGNMAVPQDISMPLDSGWNWIPYLRTSSMATATAIADVISNVTIIKSVDGKSYYPGWGFGNLTTLVPGSGYLILMTQDDELTYPANSSSRLNSIEVLQLSMPSYLIPDENTTGNSMNLLLEINNIPNDWEIGIWNSNWKLIGSGKVTNNVAMLTIWGDNEMTEAIDGGLTNELLTIKAYNIENGNVLDVNLSGLRDAVTNNSVNTLNYQKDAVLLATASIEQLASSNFAFSCVPNPFNESSTINYELEDENYVTLVITDNLGNEISRIVNNELQNTGTYQYVFNSGILPSGQYVCNLIVGNQLESKQMILMK